MSRQKKPQVRRTNINGKTEDLCIIGDGWKQLATFREIEEYTKSHKMTVSYAKMPRNEVQRQQDVLSANSDKYEIVAFKAYAAGATNILFAPRYRVQIYNKKTKQIQTYIGTMANFMFDMLNNIRGKQK